MCGAEMFDFVISVNTISVNENEFEIIEIRLGEMMSLSFVQKILEVKSIILKLWCPIYRAYS